MKNIKFKATLFIIAALTMALGPLMSATTVDAVESSALSIVPRKDYVVEPGKTVEDTMTIRNLDNQATLNLTLRVVDFTYTDESGTPKFFIDPNAPETDWSLRPFLKLPKSISIAPGGSERIDLSVTIPKGQGGGSYYSAIMYASGSGEGGNVGLSASVNTLVFVEVPGEVHESMKLEKLGAYHKGNSKTDSKFITVTSNEPQRIGYVMSNSGNIAERPTGSIILKNLFFGQDLQLANINPSGSRVLRGQGASNPSEGRLFTPCIKTKAQSVDFAGQRSEGTACVSAGLWPGLYKVSADIYYGVNGNPTQETNKVAYFWYLPWWFVFAVIVGLALIAYFIRRIVVVTREKLGRSSQSSRSATAKKSTKSSRPARKSNKKS